MAARSPKAHRPRRNAIPLAVAPTSAPSTRPSMADPLAKPMLVVRGVATFYGAIQALHGVDLDVAKGEIVTLIGANGAGKSTLLMTICGNPRGGVGGVKRHGRGR